jgi:hypothetical protein
MAGEKMHDSRTPIHIVLVHGTFARDSKWFRDGSRLRQELLSRFNGNVVFHVYKWTGLNWHSARIKGAIDFNNFLVGKLGDIDPRNIYIISHSHGGNVVLYAHGMSTNLLNILGGAIFLGTPFISYEYLPTPRSVDKHSAGAYYYGCYIVCGFSALAILALFASVSAPGIMNLVVLALVMGIALTLPETLTKNYYRRMLNAKKRMKSLCEMTETKPISENNVLIVTNRLDEPFIGLSLARFASRLVHLVRLANYYPIVAILILVVFDFYVYDMVSPEHQIKNTSLFLLFGLAFISGPVLVIWMVFSFLASKLFSLLFSSRLTFGPDLALDMRFCRLRLSRHPQSLKRARIIRSVPRLGLGAINHTYYYNDEEVLSSVVGVIEGD